MRSTRCANGCGTRPGAATTRPRPGRRATSDTPCSRTRRISPNGRTRPSPRSGTRIPRAGPTGHGNPRNSPGRSRAGPSDKPGPSGTMDLPGLTQPHPRDRRTMREDPRTRGRHPRGHLTRPLQRRARGIQRQDQGHHPHGLRLPPRRQSHRHDQTPMQRPTHPPANTHPLTHENSRRL